MSYSELTHLLITLPQKYNAMMCILGSACAQPMRCTHVHRPAKRHRIALIAAHTWDVRCARATCAVDTQWSVYHTRHHTQWRRHSCVIRHVSHPCTIGTPLIRNTCEIVTPEMFHQTILVISLRICSFFRTPYERRGIAGQWNRGIEIGHRV